MTKIDERQVQLQTWVNTHTEFNTDRLSVVSGDASFRRYFRTTPVSIDPQGNPVSVIVVDAPDDPESVRRFVNLSNAYHECGAPVPRVYAHDAELGFYCQQDFGSTLLADTLSQANSHELLVSALNLLPVLQRCVTTQSGPLARYDEALLSRDFGLFTRWLLGDYLNLTLTTGEQACLAQVDKLLRDTFQQQPQVGVHRDYHSRNLMVLPDAHLGVIDFQDAVVGPLTYDAVSLLRDCYHRLPDEQVIALLQQWWQSHYAEIPWQTFKRWFDLTGIQRHIKASGIFARLHLRDAKSTYLADIPRTLGYIKDVGCLYAETQELAAFIEQRVQPAWDELCS